MSAGTIREIERCDELVAWRAMKTPSATALIFNGQPYSYRQLALAIDCCARDLIERGVKKGDRVATLSAPGPEFVITFLASVSIGAIWQGLNPRYKVAELEYAINDARPKVIFAPRELDGRKYYDEIAVLSGETSTVVDISQVRTDPPSTATDDALSAFRRAVSGDDPAVVVYTSGSTGAPKGALLRHKAIVSMSRLQGAVWPVDPLVALNFLPINHVGSIVDITMPVFAAGGTLVLMDQFEPDRSLELMEAHGVTVWGSIPSVFHLQLACPRFAKTDFSAVQLIVWEGAPMPRDTISALRKICPRMATNYGMTETTSAVTILEPTDDEEVLENSVGAPVEGADVRIADAEGRALGVGEVGEIQTRSDYNMAGYWEREEATKAAFTQDGYLRTGDLGEWREDGRIRIVGRLKEMFKSGGYNVYPREIEDLLERHEQVAAAAVVGAGHAVWGEVGVAFVLPCGAVSEKDLEIFTRKRLANYKVPKLFRIIETIPLLPIGKIDKKALQKQAQALLDA